jgi:hypothetical protein
MELSGIRAQQCPASTEISVTFISNLRKGCRFLAAGGSPKFPRPDLCYEQPTLLPK